MLRPLTQRLSQNETPALRIEDLEEGRTSTNDELVARWKHLLCTEDLLDLTEFVPLLDRLGYRTFQDRGRRLEIAAEGTFTARLIGARTTTGEDVVRSSPVTVDLHSAGAVGLDFQVGHDCVRWASFEGGPAFFPSKAYPEMYVARVTDRAHEPAKQLEAYTWPEFMQRVGLPEEANIAIYTAGGAARAFAEAFFRRGLHRRYKIQCFMDREKTGEMLSIPILRPQEGLKTGPDYVFVASLLKQHFDPIRNFLQKEGLRPDRDFCRILFADQPLNLWY